MLHRDRWIGVGAVILVANVIIGSPSRGLAGEEKKTVFRFEFGAAEGLAGAESLHVAPSTLYSKEVGYGFEPGGKLDIGEGAGVSSHQPFYFSVAVPEGNYKVTATLGDVRGESETTVKAELRRLMVENVRTGEGKLETRRFVVNVRTPDYSGGKVHLKAPRETTTEAWAWDEKLTLEFNGKRPSVWAGC